MLLPISKKRYANVAVSLECHGIRVEQPGDLAQALKTAMSTSGPTVVDFIVTRDPAKMLPGVDNRAAEIKRATGSHSYGTRLLCEATFRQHLVESCHEVSKADLTLRTRPCVEFCRGQDHPRGSVLYCADHRGGIWLTL
jgi:hypothetical protein